MAWIKTKNGNYVDETDIASVSINAKGEVLGWVKTPNQEVPEGFFFLTSESVPTIAEAIASMVANTKKPKQP